LNLDAAKEYIAIDILNKTEMKVQDSFETNLIPEEAKLFKIKM
jgi:hypothetical protein